MYLLRDLDLKPIVFLCLRLMCLQILWPHVQSLVEWGVHCVTVSVMIRCAVIRAPHRCTVGVWCGVSGVHQCMTVSMKMGTKFPGGIGPQKWNLVLCTGCIVVAFHDV